MLADSRIIANCQRYSRMDIQTNGEVLGVSGLDTLSGVNSGEFKDLIRTHLKPGHRVVEVDFSKIRLVDSEGLGALISIRRMMTGQNGRVRLASPKPSVRQVLDLVQFHRIFEIVD